MIRQSAEIIWLRRCVDVCVVTGMTLTRRAGRQAVIDLNVIVLPVKRLRRTHNPHTSHMFPPGRAVLEAGGWSPGNTGIEVRSRASGSWLLAPLSDLPQQLCTGLSARLVTVRQALICNTGQS